jgi:hypothetical protein
MFRTAPITAPLQANSLFFLIHSLYWYILVIYRSTITSKERQKSSTLQCVWTYGLNKGTPILRSPIFHVPLRHLRNYNWSDKPLLNLPLRGLRWNMRGLVFEKTQECSQDQPGYWHSSQAVPCNPLAPVSFYNFFNAKGSQPARFPSSSLFSLPQHHYESAGRTYVTPTPSCPSTKRSAFRLWSRRLDCNRVLGNRLLLSENAEIGIGNRHIRDDVRPGEGRPRPPNLTHHDLLLGPRSQIPKVSVNCGQTRIQTGYYRPLHRGFHHTASMGRQPASRCFYVGATPRERLPFY